jgi:hypothetical protein
MNSMPYVRSFSPERGLSRTASFSDLSASGQFPRAIRVLASP